MWPMAVLVAVLVLRAAPAVAQDLYKCKMPDGRTVISNAPCAGANDETVLPSAVSSPRAAPSPQPATPLQPSQAPTGEPSPASSNVSPPPLPLEPAPQETSKTPAQPVDTLQFGLLRSGMSEATIVQRLGAPGEVLQMPTVFRWSGRDLVEIRRYAWVYPGTNQIMRTTLYFENGVMVDKVKTPASGVR